MLLDYAYEQEELLTKGHAIVYSIVGALWPLYFLSEIAIYFIKQYQQERNEKKKNRYNDRERKEREGEEKRGGKEEKRILFLI
jgi:hypothetical protein